MRQWYLPRMTARILVVRLSALGDIVFAVPAVAALRERFPDAKIDWLVEDRFEGLVRSLPLIDEVLTFPRRRWKEAGFARGLGVMAGHVRHLRARVPYDAILDFQGNLKSTAQLRFVRGELKIGFDKGVSKEGAARQYDLKVADPGRVSRARRDLALVQRLLSHHRLEPFDDSMPKVAPWPLRSAAVRDIAAAISSDHDDFVLLHHGFTEYGRDKEWPIEHWAELCKRLHAAGQQPRLLWTPAERERAEQILAAAEGTAGLAPETASLDHLMALLDASQLVIGTDSGPVHLAALRGSKVLCLFGPTDPVRFVPPGPRVTAIAARGTELEPPRRDRSRRSPLMDELLPSAVFDAAQGLLA